MRKHPTRTSTEDIGVGRIAGVFGVRGELKCDATRAALPLFKPGAGFRYEKDKRSGSIAVRSVREHQKRLLISLEGVDDATAAEGLVGATLFAPKSAIPLDPDEYLDEDLVGCDVVGSSGKRYGIVDRVEHYPSSDMLVVNGKMIPMVSAIVREVDIAHRHIVIDPPAGLLD
jgi:16S rRNA processing protein RimM